MPQNIKIIQVYAPTSNATDEKSEDFYNELETVLTNYEGNAPRQLNINEWVT